MHGWKTAPYTSTLMFQEKQTSGKIEKADVVVVLVIVTRIKKERNTMVILGGVSSERINDEMRLTIIFVMRYDFNH